MLTKDENKMLAKITHKAFGSQPNASVVEYLNNDETLKVPILICPDHPQQNFTAYATIGLSDYSMRQGNREFPTRLEIISIGNTKIKWLPGALSTAAFYIMKEKWLCHPGATLVDILNGYAIDSDLEHLYFTSPFLWETDLKTIELATKQVAWLLAIPITNREYEYRKQYGNEKFEELMEKNNASVFDLTRKSII